MPGSATHIAIADKINNILGEGVIKNLSLFFGGNIAPDAVHSKKDYKRADKKHSHLCDGIRSYGYGYPDKAKLFKDMVNDFIEGYYMSAGNDKDLYFGYLVHLLTDEFYLLSVYERLESHLISNGSNPEEPGFRKKIADEVNDDPEAYNPALIDFFREASSTVEISAYNYGFKQNVVDVLKAVWDYEVKDYISVTEINSHKQWVIDTFFRGGKTKSDADSAIASEFVGLAANSIINSLSCEGGIVRLLQ